MGCDIHGWIEKKENGEWVKVEAIRGDRNSMMFSIIAGVRLRTFSPEPISPAKGFPVGGIVDESYDYMGHSASWLTAGEIEAYKEKQPTVKMRGIMDAETYKQFLETGSPYPYCQDVFGDRVRMCPAEQILKLQAEQPNLSYHCEVTWEVPIEQECPELFEEILPKLREHGPESRLVFWFDS